MSPAAQLDVLAIGTLSRNRFWGEGDDAPVRATACTSTLIRSDGVTIVVDPGHDPATMERLLDDRAGLRATDVDLVFVTHRHGDHRVGIDAFPRADLLMGGAELAAWSREGDAGDAAQVERFRAAPFELTRDVRLVPTPGHTGGHTSVFVESEAETILVAGDAVMTREFFQNRAVFFNSVDPDEAARSLDLVGRSANLVVPGHDNVFAPVGVVRRLPPGLR
jgi:glyoxylase-like metal-dependent hydrolase (beta-lactamase superfamily II)